MANDKVVIAGYDVVATAQVTGGGPAGIEEIVVLNNNHNYYLVVGRGLDEPAGVLLEKYGYDETERAATAAYHMALNRMIMEAKSR